MEHKQYNVFPGRFQPLQKGHEWLFRQSLDKGEPVLVLIRDIPPDEKNPLTAQQVEKLIQAAFEGEDLKTMIIPDIKSINYGRTVGYAVTEHVPPPDIGRISATEIRESIRSGDDKWKELVNPRIHDLVIEMLG